MSKTRLARITGYRTLTSYDIADLTGEYSKVLMVYIGRRFCGYTRLN